MAFSAASLGIPLQFSQSFFDTLRGRDGLGFGVFFWFFVLLEDAQVAASILTMSQSITLYRNARC